MLTSSLLAFDGIMNIMLSIGIALEEGAEATAEHLRDNLTVVADLRVQQVNTALGLVGTIFLPLTFLTGVFGSK